MRYFESPAYGKFCEAIYGSDSKQMGMVTDGELNVFFREAMARPGGQALDLGCGAGFMAERVAGALGVHVTGIDINADTVEFASARFSENPSLKFVQMDFENLIFPEDTWFDLIYAFDALYFTASDENLRSLLTRCMELLKPGGKLAVFWSNQSKPGSMESGDPASTQLGIWAKNSGVTYRAFDFTREHRAFWINGLQLLKEMEPEFRAENYEGYDGEIEEFTMFSDLSADGGRIFRWLYVFEK